MKNEECDAVEVAADRSFCESTSLRRSTPSGPFATFWSWS